MAESGRFPLAFTSFGDLGTPGAGATYVQADGTTVPSNAYSESQWNAYSAVSEIELMATTPVAAGLPDTGLTAGALAPLFHLMNGDLCYGDKATVTPKPKSPATTPAAGGTTTAAGAQPAPEVWRDYGLNVQRSAANRPWMPCVGNHEVELDNADNGLASYLTRFMLPDNGSTQFSGSYYSFQVGSVLFISLDANDVCYQGAGAYNVGAVQTRDGGGGPNGSGAVIYPTAYQYNQYDTGTFAQNPDGTLSPAGASPNAQTLWLETQLSAARASTEIDWIVVQIHQCALSSTTDNGSDAGIRQAWVPLFDRYEVDLVLKGHDHDYERSWPVRGFTPNLGTSLWTTSASVVQQSGFVNMATPPMVSVAAVIAPAPNVNTFTPTVVASGQVSPFDTTKGTVYLTLGGGGTDKNDNLYNPENTSAESAYVTTFTQVRTGAKPTPDSWEPAAWSAVTDPQVSPTNLGYPYGVAYFSVDPGEQGGATTITVTYVHAVLQANIGSDTPGPSYTQFDQFQVTRPRSDAPPVPTPEFPSSVLALGGAAFAAGAAVLGQQRHAARAQSRAISYPSAVTSTE
jgi:alkaline phosphatase D